MQVFVHERVSKRHPELSDDDVLSAWDSRIAWALRMGGDHNQIVATGFDKKGRLIEMVAVANGGDCLIFHAMTPPSKRTLKELDLIGRKR